MALWPSLLSKTLSVLVFGFVVLNCFVRDKFGSHAQGSAVLRIVIPRFSQKIQPLPRERVVLCVCLNMALWPSLLNLKLFSQKTSSVLVFGFVALNCFVGDRFGSHAQGVTQLLPLDEVQILRNISDKLNISNWVTIDRTSCNLAQWWKQTIDDKTQSIVQCNCTFENGSVCHVTNIRVKGFNLNGVLPEELGDLPELVEIDLTRNYISGTIPPRLAQLPKLKILSLIVNRLTGPIPPEIGNITTLEQLVLEDNLLGGSLPPDLGNLTSLRRLVLSANKFTGTIPDTFGNLKSLNEFMIDGSELSGKIPDFIGNWTNITTLDLQGTSMEGPIPSNISQLTSLKYLRISDLSGSSSTLPNLQAMNSLEILQHSEKLLNYWFNPRLHCNYVVFENFGFEHQQVDRQYLYLQEFEKCNGISEQQLTNWRSAKLGIELQQASVRICPTTILAILGGQLLVDANRIKHCKHYLAHYLFSLPSLSHVAHYSTLKFNRNLVSSYLSNSNTDEWCFTKGLPCTQNPERNMKETTQYCYSMKESLHKITMFTALLKDIDCSADRSLFINCGGGSNVRFNDNTYEVDSTDGGPASFFFSQGEWGYSSTGSYLESSNTGPFLAKNVFNLSVEGVYATARLAPQSLKYYALCLAKGKYKVQLHFAEIMYSNDQTYRSLGRRIFDISIQGIKLRNNFNIAEKAGGVGIGITEVFDNIIVNGSTLEIHLYWAGKGTTFVPDRGVHGPLISAIAVTPYFKKGGLSVGAVIGIAAASCVFAALFLLLLRTKGYLGGKDLENKGRTEGTELRGLDLQTGYFTLRQIKHATNNFNPANKIGEGGFGPVYKGVLSDGPVIAVKQLSSKSRQGNREFVNEIGMISALQHPHLVKLYGCCIEGNQLLLVYEYLENNSLARALFVFPHDIESKAYVLHERNNLLELVDPRLGSSYSKEEAMKMLNLALLCTNQSPSLRPRMSSVVRMLEGNIPVEAPIINHGGTDQEARFRALELLSQDSQTQVSTSSRSSEVQISRSRDGPWIDSSFSLQSQDETKDLYPISID
ncbi:hypothetical protein SADUNF_Sadunf16G0251600 [Salix dunnii]|uniref:non-specific serine/threonine protein kinase n=1 Tax=Salix dunnii TaxID=1413687 RepID=A0A835JBL5_9ROSI|nr:hypothetical protein SADUNF_Sadunf16G0251600 [Salix dunnii]